jgi:hypothetical protein
VPSISHKGDAQKTNSDDFSNFAHENQMTIILTDDQIDGDYALEPTLPQDDVEDGTNIPFEKYADYLCIKKEVAEIIWR